VTRYAEGTSVTSSRSVEEVDRLLSRYGADGFFYTRADGKAMIGFRHEGRMYSMRVPLPDPTSRDFTHTPTRGTRRDENSARAAYEQEVNRRYRALVATVRGLLVGVAEGIVRLDQAFFAWVVMPDGRTLAEVAGPQLDRAYETGVMPRLLLPGLPAGGDE